VYEITVGGKTMKRRFPRPRQIKFPITVHKIEFRIDKPFTKPDMFSGAKVGDWVSVRPCAKECEGKTFIGIFLGGMPIHVGASYSSKTKKGKERKKKILEFYHTGDNPTMYVPDLKRVVFGYESWWGAIKSENDLRQITDKDISNVWYVKALKALSENKIDKNENEKTVQHDRVMPENNVAR
jgi:hypothetical protein